MQHEDLPSGEADYLLRHPLLNEILDRLESDAKEAIINTDDEARRATHVLEVRTIRNLRQQLTTLSKGKTKPPQMRRMP